MAHSDQSGGRKRLLAAVHMGAKALAMAEDDYRAMLVRVTGRDSAGKCNDAQLRLVLNELQRLGFHNPRRDRISRATHPVAKKARALWLGLYALGAIDDASERGLEALGKRQLGIDRLHWADQSQSAPLIEALKGMAERHGWDQRLPTKLTSEQRGRMLTERLVACLLANLGRAPRADLAELDDAALLSAVADLGAAWRAQLAGGQ